MKPALEAELADLVSPAAEIDANCCITGSTMRDNGVDEGTVAVPAKPPLVIGCGALARELVELTRRAGMPAMDLTCLPASLHNRPERIPGAVAARIRRARADGYDRIFVAYADCGTGGLLDRVLEAEGIPRLEGAHCYEVYAGRAAFEALAEEEPGTFYLTDFLVRNFDRLVVRGLGLDRHPELLPLYFGNYRRLLYLAQTDDPDLDARARAAADRLGLAFEHRLTGHGELAGAVAAFRALTSIDASQTRNRAEDGNSPPPASPRSPIVDSEASNRREVPRIARQRAGLMSARHQQPHAGPNPSRGARVRREFMSARQDRRQSNSAARAVTPQVAA